jgi:hypothetical protein
MDLSRFEKMPDDARVWVYGFDRTPDADTRARVTEVLDQFIESWESHAVRVAGTYDIVEERFLVLAGYCTDGISGCSADSSVRVVKIIRDHLGLDGLDRSLVFFRDGDGRARSLPRTDFQREVDSGTLGPGTVVFDTTIQTVADLRAGRLETTFEKSWHAKAFQRTT